MKQIFEHYEKWECYKNGMYNLSDVTLKRQKVFGSIELLSTPDLFYKACKELIKAWPVSSSVNLTNKQQNRRAWLGAAASMFVHQCPEYLTRLAWGLLEKQEQDAANEVAEKVIFEYVNKTSNAKTLFD